MTGAILSKSFLIPLTAISLSLGFILWQVRPGPDAPPVPASTTAERDAPPSILLKDFSIAVYNDDSKSFSKLDADALHVKPRKFYIFNIKPFNYAIIDNAKLEIHFHAGIPADIDFPFDKEYLLSNSKKNVFKSIDSITGLVINGLILDIYKSSELYLQVKAEKSFVDFLRNNEVEMRNSILENVFSKKVIRSNLIVWDTKEKVFKVPGEYVAMNPQGRATGKGIKVHLDFTVTPLARTEYNSSPYGYGGN